MSPPATCVIYNPASGRGRALQRLERLRRAWQDRAVFWPTTAAGQAEDLALRAAHEGFSIVAAAGGDGTVHEVANGILRAACPNVVLAVLPVGSANDYAHSLGLPPDWWLSTDLAVAPRPVDVGVARAGGRTRYFLNGLGLGFNGRVTLEAQRIRWLQGVALYGLALLRALCFHFVRPRLTVHLDGVDRSCATLALSLAIGRREGNFVVAPQALLDDGQFDYVHAGPLTPFDALRLLPRLFTGRLPAGHPRLWLGRCRSARISAALPLVVHLDGEMFCVPSAAVREIEVELLPGALRALCLPGASSFSLERR
jgi:diacylglycerol kinase family enzyme